MRLRAQATPCANLLPFRMDVLESLSEKESDENLLGQQNDNQDVWKAIIDMKATMTDMARSMSQMMRSFVSDESADGDADSCVGDQTSTKRRKTADEHNPDHDSDLEAILDGGESGEKEDSDDKLLQEIEKEFDDSESTGPKINQHLANITNKRFSSKLEFGKLKEKMALYDRPANCESLVVPKINPEIWGKLNSAIKSQDLRMANVQKAVVKASTAVAISVEMVLNSKSNVQEQKSKLISTMSDAIALLGHASYDMSLRRRELLKPAINKELRSLCGQQTQVTDLLFGNDIQNSLKAIQECNKISKTLTPNKGPKFDQKKSEYSDSPKPFLGKGRGRGNDFKKKARWHPKQKEGQETS